LLSGLLGAKAILRLFLGHQLAANRQLGELDLMLSGHRSPLVIYTTPVPLQKSHEKLSRNK